MFETVYPNNHIEQCTWDVGIFHLVMLLDKAFTTVDTVHTGKYPVGFSCGVLSMVITSIAWRNQTMKIYGHFLANSAFCGLAI